MAEDGEHFDGKRFFNQDRGGDNGLGALLKWATNRDKGPWHTVEDEPRPPPPERSEDLRVTWVGHSTVLVQVAGANLLTDPFFSERASPLAFAGPKRVRPPGVRFEDLPPIDVVVVSHNHYDHMDLPTLQRLARDHAPEVITGRGNGPYLSRREVPAQDLDWWEHHEAAGLRVHFVPARHFSARGPTDRDKTLWGGFVVEGGGRKVFFAGDTGWGRHFAQVRERLGPMDLGLLPIGAFRPQWLMSPVHIGPEEAVRAHQVLEARHSLAIHHSTVPLADDGMDEAPDLLDEELAKAGVSAECFWKLPPGEGHMVP